eukprot:4367512-Pyramimonas_sp.AAC.1
MDCRAPWAARRHLFWTSAPAPEVQGASFGGGAGQRQRRPSQPLSGLLASSWASAWGGGTSSSAA